MNHYEAKGIAAVLPGLELVLASIATEVDNMLELVRESENPANQNSGPALEIRTLPTHQDAKQRGVRIGAGHVNRSQIARRTWKKKTAKQKRDWIAAINRGRRLNAKKKEAKV